jgi:hypothetical protein
MTTMPSLYEHRIQLLGRVGNFCCVPVDNPDTERVKNQELACGPSATKQRDNSPRPVSAKQFPYNLAFPRHQTLVKSEENNGHFM